MSATTNDYENLRHYLLGRLPEEEERPLEARLLADSELFELAEATEAEILDECFRSEISPADCQGFLERLGASPAGRRRIALAQGLAAVTSHAGSVADIAGIADTAGIAPSASRPETATILPFRRLLARPAVRVALAAALVGAAVAVWQTLPISSPTLPPASSGRFASSVRPAGEVVRATRAPRATPSPFVFNLSLITFRGGGESLPELKIPAGTTEVQLRLLLSSGETSAAYDVSLKREGEDVGSPRHLAAPRAPGEPLVVSLPASVLASGIYEVEVRGVASDGSHELIGNSYFRIPR